MQRPISTRHGSGTEATMTLTAPEAVSTPTSSVPTLFTPGANCCAVARSERVGLLVDGAAYFAAFRDAAESAERSIFIVGWDFDSGVLLDPTSDNPVKLGEFLNGLASR